MRPEPIVALEIGTGKIVALVGEVGADGFVMITGMGVHESKGVRKGEIVDLDTAAACVRAAIQDAEESAKVDIGEVHLAVSGGHIRGVINTGRVRVLSSDRIISDDDIDSVTEVAKSMSIPEDREILHTVPQHYCINDQQYVTNPAGMEGGTLTLNMLILHGVVSRIRNTVRAVRSLPLGVADVVFGGLCSGLAILTPEQKESGVVVIDMGAGTTDYVVYADSVVAASGSIAVGGDHVANDIALAFNIHVQRAETLKKEHGSAMLDESRSAESISLPAEVGFPASTIKIGALDAVINARMDELLDIVKKQLSDKILGHVGAGVVLTGGLSALNGVTDLASTVFGLPCAIGKPRNVSGLASAIDGPECATCVGLIQHAHMTAGQEEAGLGGWLKNMFGWGGR